MRFVDEYLKDIKRQKNTGRCLHFEAGERCNNIVNAHTIQKGNLLSLIQEEGHVINISANYSDLKRNGGELVAKKVGVNKVSTFFGFCQKHDNELFELIDNYPFLPSKEQAFLYSYRALCREYFTKENSIKIFENEVSSAGLSDSERHFLEASLLGSLAGFKHIKYHKERFEESLRSSHLGDIRYVSFNVSERPTVLVSGVILPDYDFLGHELQDLGNLDSTPSLAAFFTAPTTTGWSFVFAWHSASDQVCERLRGSLATCVYNKESLSDILFRCVFSWSENHAINPSWWESITQSEKEEICERSLSMVHPEIPISNDYLRVGLKEICKWKVGSVQNED